MKTYWDYTDNERAELTESEVTRLLDFELMTKGVFKPKPVVLVDVVEPKLETREFARIRYGGSYGHAIDIAFATLAQAQAFVALEPMAVRHDYDGGNARYFAAPLVDGQVYIEPLTNEQEIGNQKAALKKASAGKQANETALAEHRKLVQAVERATSGVWDDWHAMIAKAAKMKRIAETRAEYLALCEGNEALADKATAKTFGDDEIAAWRAWNGAETATPEPEPKPVSTTSDDVPF